MKRRSPDSADAVSIETTVTNRQRMIPIGNMEFYRSFARRAMALVLDPEFCPKGPNDSVLTGRDALLTKVDFVFVSDRKIADIHKHFMQVDGPTDVITFDHGEIIVGTEVAARQAEEYSETLEREVFRYMVHGLLHLHGYDDKKPLEFRAMWMQQERFIWELSGKHRRGKRMPGIPNRKK